MFASHNVVRSSAISGSISGRKMALFFSLLLITGSDFFSVTPVLSNCLRLSLIGVQSAAVNVICELARKNPKNYLSLAPLFFKLMTSSTNNWMLIKIIKLVSENH